MPQIDRRALLLAAAGTGLVAIPVFAGSAADQTHAGVRELERLESEYNKIIVRQEGERVLMYFVVGSCEFPQSAWLPGDPDHLVFTYTRAATAALLYPKKLDRMLEIGLGGGRTSMYVKRHLPGLAITSVDIDPKVIEVAKRRFGVVADDRLKLVADDGRRFVNTSKDRFDLIFIDAYRGTWVPETLTTVEFFQAVKRRLAPGGAVAQNVEPTTLFFDGMVATLKTVFDQVDVFRTGGAVSNAVLVAYDGEQRAMRELQVRARLLQDAHNFRHPLPDLLAMHEAAPQVVSGPFRDQAARGANEALMIDRANDPNTPRQRSQQCGA